MQSFLDKKYDKAILVYNQFKNAATQNVVTENFLPIISASKDSNASGSIF